MKKEIKCHICKEVVCKYIMDLRNCGGMIIEGKIICIDCSKKIARELIGE